MIYKPYKVYNSEVLVKVQPNEDTTDAVRKLNAGEWENAD